MLTDTAVRQAKPGAKIRKLHDERGLYLEVAPTGSKRWRFKYRFQGREKRISLGVYPDVKLKRAREKRDAAREQVADGIDPSVARKAERATRGNTFEKVAWEWYERNRPSWSESHATITRRRLERHVLPELGSRPIAEVKAPELLRVLHKIQEGGAVETARRIRGICGAIFRYAVATGRAERDPSADLRGALPTPPGRHFASFHEPGKVGELLRALAGYEGSFTVRCALRLLPLVFVRPGELRHAVWTEIDWDRSEWRIPAKRMKSRRPHTVPLAPQALAVLRELAPVTHRGPNSYLFPSERTATRPISENTLNAALRRMGFSKNELTSHGVRSMMTTLLYEHGWESDVVERQLAHVQRNKVRASYDHAQHLERRRHMMHWLADYLDRLREGQKAEVVPLGRA